MWNTGTVGDITVYMKHAEGVKYEIHSSDKLELIVRDANRQTTQYLRFEGDSARNYKNEFYDEAEVEKLVNSIPEIDQLPKDISAMLRAVKKKDSKKPEAPTAPDE